MKYEIIFGLDGETPAFIYEPSIGFIPFDEANSDYQAYLLWLEAQDVAE